MEPEIVLVSDDFESLETYARKLILSTLAAVVSPIEIVAVKIEHSLALPLATFDYRCTMLLKLGNGSTLRSEAYDVDDHLVIYRALTKLIDQLPLSKLEPGQIVTDQFGQQLEC